MARSKVNCTATAKNLKHRVQRWAVILGAISVGCLGSGAAADEWIPYRCCPKTDCQVTEAALVVEVQGGFAVEGVDGVVAYDDPRVRLSQDGQFHACIRSQARPFMSVTAALLAGSRKELKCLFVPLTG